LKRAFFRLILTNIYSKAWKEVTKNCKKCKKKIFKLYVPEKQQNGIITANFPQFK
jgi:hypothetical protein